MTFFKLMMMPEKPKKISEEKRKESDKLPSVRIEIKRWVIGRSTKRLPTMTMKR